MTPINHDSDCAMHNEPALPAGPCDCGADKWVGYTLEYQMDGARYWVDILAADDADAQRRLIAIARTGHIMATPPGLVPVPTA